MNIKVQHKNNYGTDLFYPVCDTAIRFCHLTGTKTLTVTHINTIKAMGIEVSIVKEEIKGLN